MEVIQIRRESQSFDRALNVVVNVCGRIVDFSVFENSNATFRCNFESSAESVYRDYRKADSRKILLRTLCFRMKSPRTFSFTPLR